MGDGHRVGNANPDYAAVFAKAPFLHREAGDLTGNEPLQALPFQHQVVGMSEFAERHFQQFFAGISQDLAQAVVYLKHALASQVKPLDPNRGLLEEEAEPLLAFPQCHFDADCVGYSPVCPN